MRLKIEWKDRCAVKSSTGVWHVLRDCEDGASSLCGRAGNHDGEVVPMDDNEPACSMCRRVHKATK